MGMHIRTIHHTVFIDPLRFIYIYISRLTVVSREAKEEVPCDGLSTNAREYFTIKTHGSESRGQGGSTLRRPLDERT